MAGAGDRDTAPEFRRRRRAAILVKPPRHLLTLWNPSYAEDALDAHLRVLLRWAERSRHPADAASPEEDVYVWWATVSPRQYGGGAPLLLIWALG
jgi:hypothetical protein